MAGSYAANRYGGYIPISTTPTDTGGGGDGTFVKKIYIEKHVEKPLPTIRLSENVEEIKDIEFNIELVEIEEGE